MEFRGTGRMGTAARGSAALAAIGLCLAATAASKPQKSSSQEPKQAGERIPAYHKNPPTGPLPETLPPEVFPAGSMQRKAYAMAGEIKRVLYQEPCYCYCDRDEHHHSLLDCYTSQHASNCGICMGEAVYAYEETLKGRTPAEIRVGIIHGDWRKALAHP